MKFTNKVYDVLKVITMIVLPAFGALYFSVANIWGLPYVEQVLGTISAIELFLGSMLKISSSSYNGEGTLKIDIPEDDNEPIKYVFDVDEPDSLIENKFVMFKVDKK